LVQEINKLPDDAGMNITIQRYLTPSGNDIHKKGITPDIVVELTKENVDAKDDVQLKKAIEVLKEMTCLGEKSGKLAGG
jgi:carboxyl-terminal processing protease